MLNKLSGEGKFALKISFFNSLGFAHAVGIPTFVDPLLRTHVRYGAREYPLGPWVLLLTLPVFVGTYLCMLKYPKHRHLFSWLPLAILGIAVLRNFLPERPHGNVAVWVLLYSIASVIATWIRYTPLRFEYANDNSINVNARIERIKETISQWRMISLSMTGGFLAVIIPWTTFLWSTLAVKVVMDSGERFLLAVSSGFQVAVLCVYVFLGPVFEAFRKSFSASDGLLKIKELTKEERYP